MKNLFRIVGVLFLIFSIHSCEEEDANAIKDVDGNVYNTVTIGTQLWMKGNLRTTRYSNGDLIGTTTPATLDISGETTPKYQWTYDGDENNVAAYGRLYTWYAVTDNRNICPTGWHVPTDEEWTTLTTYLGGESIAGGKLKEAGTSHWFSENVGATNESGFTALPGGTHKIDTFYNIRDTGFWWSSTEGSATQAYNRFINYYGNYIGRYNSTKQNGSAVRCLKD